MRRKLEERFEIFTGLINKISRSIKKIKNQEMAGRGLRGVQVSCLYYLFCREGLTSGELCERCEEDKATISRAVEYLEREGYVTLPTPTEKRYKRRLFLTEKGKEAGREVYGKVSDVLRRVSLVLPEAERISFYASLALISESLEEFAKTK